jgi:NAD(P)-dependent dehydrogenase (short-subunit alcohol dehydrogenase family)
VLEDLAGKVAVITGAGSGIGAALARACAGRGMSVVAADVNVERLDAVVAGLKEAGSPAIAVRVDVSDPGDVERLAELAYETFGATHLLCNNAGISPLGRVWEFTAEDWARLVGVNFLGMAHGIRSFIPRMIAGGEPGHVVNTGSGGSFTVQPIIGAYSSTKHAILGLTDTLRLELAPHDIGVTLLCPGGANTNIFESMRRPSFTGDDQEVWGYAAEMVADFDEATTTTIEPDHVAELALWGVTEGLPYVICAPGQRPGVQRRFDAILSAHGKAAEHDPTLP